MLKYVEHRLVPNMWFPPPPWCWGVLRIVDRIHIHIIIFLSSSLLLLVLSSLLFFYFVITLFWFYCKYCSYCFTAIVVTIAIIVIIVLLSSSSSSSSSSSISISISPSYHHYISTWMDIEKWTDITRMYPVDGKRLPRRSALSWAAGHGHEDAMKV